MHTFAFCITARFSSIAPRKFLAVHGGLSPDLTALKAPFCVFPCVCLYLCPEAACGKASRASVRLGTSAVAHARR